MKKVKAFLKENGFNSVLVLGGSAVAFVFGHVIVGACLLTFFVGRNYEIIKKLIKEKIS
jgi:hypothetical protein